LDKAISILDWLKHAFEYMGGAQDEPPAGFPIRLGQWWYWALWWSALVFVIYVFCGQSSKFIYIDF
jgi:hypothetical protein